MPKLTRLIAAARMTMRTETDFANTALCKELADAVSAFDGMPGEPDKIMLAIMAFHIQQVCNCKPDCEYTVAADWLRFMAGDS